MSKVSAIRSSAKEDRTNIPKPEEIFSHGERLGESAVADGNHENDIRLRAYEIYVQHGQEPRRWSLFPRSEPCTPCCLYALCRRGRCELWTRLPASLSPA
jgi:hypothetical protein